MQRQKPVTYNVKLKPYQETDYPFGKPVEFKEIHAFGTETAGLFAEAEAKRVAADALKKRKRPFVANNAEALEKTGQLAASPLTERWQKKSDTLFRMINAYNGDKMKANKNFSYREIDAVRYLLDPEQREDALQSLVEYAQVKEKKKMLLPIIKVGLAYKINLPLDALSDKMAARDLLSFLKNKAAISDKKAMAQDETVLKQFKELDAKTDELKSSAIRRQTYTAMAAMAPLAKDAQLYREKAVALPLTKSKPAKKANSSLNADILLGDLEKYVQADKDQPSDQSALAVLAAFEEAEENIRFLDIAAQSKAYERMYALHPNKTTANFYYLQAIETANAIDNPSVKAKRLLSLREAAPDKQKRDTVHKLFAENAPFNLLVTDAVSIVEKQTQNYADILRISHDEIVKQKTVSTARQTFYHKHKPVLEKATLGWLLKW